jgi:hypothetical protein
MPCKSDYLDPTPDEIKLSKVLGCLEEIETGKLPENYGTGFGGAYGNTRNISVDEKTAELCSKLQKLSNEEIKEKSLELQMWWRDHQEFDKRRIQEELASIKEESERKEALKKLTPHEINLLGLNK